MSLLILTLFQYRALAVFFSAIYLIEIVWLMRTRCVYTKCLHSNDPLKAGLATRNASQSHWQWCNSWDRGRNHECWRSFKVNFSKTFLNSNFSPNSLLFSTKLKLKPGILDKFKLQIAVTLCRNYSASSYFPCW